MSNVDVQKKLMLFPFQAKANELQLLKHWGQAAATKRQTQMKYGFWFLHHIIIFKKNLKINV